MHSTLPVQPPDPTSIMHTGLGFWASKTLLAAIKFDLFTLLSGNQLPAQDIKKQLGLHDRSLYDFLDALVALGFLRREGIMEEALYGNAPDADFFLNKKKPSYIGGMLEMANDRLYGFWGNLEEALKTGQPQNEEREEGVSPFEVFYQDETKMLQFMEAMAGIQMGAFMAFANTFNFKPYKTLCDMGGATGALSIKVAQQHPHMHCITFDLPKIEPVAKRSIEKAGLKSRIEVVSGDFFKDEFPRADIITMGNILHDWGKEEKLSLMQAAYNALPANGAFVAIENLIDNERNKNAFGLLMSLNMLIETNNGYDMTFAHFKELGGTVGFKRFELLPLAGPTSAAIAYK